MHLLLNKKTRRLARKGQSSSYTQGTVNGVMDFTQYFLRKSFWFFFLFFFKFVNFLLILLLLSNLKKNVVLSLTNLNCLTQECFEPSLAEICQQFLKRFCYFVNIFPLFRFSIPLEKGMSLIGTLSSPKDILSKGKLKLIQLFWGDYADGQMHGRRTVKLN